MAGSSSTIGIRLLLRGQDAVKSGLKGVGGGIKDLATKSDLANRSMEKLGGGPRNLGSLAVKMTATVGLAGGALLGTMVAVGVKTAAANEQAQTAFTNMLGSAGKAREYLGELKAFAANTPFELKDVQLGAQRLMAMGVATKNVLPYMTAIGDAVSGMGGSADQINQVVLAIGQIQAKGKVQGDELMQLTEAGIPALKILADQYGVTTTQMAKMSEQGKVTADKALPLLIDGIENGTKSTKAFGGMMDQQSKTLVGRWSNIKDTVTQGLAGAVEPLLPLLGTVMDWVGDRLPAGMDLLREGGKRVAAVLNVMRPVFGDLWQAAKDVARAFAEGFEASGVSLDDFRGGADRLHELLRPGSDFMVGISMMAEGLGVIVGLGTRLAGSMVLVTKPLGWVAEFLKGIRNYVIQTEISLMNIIGSVARVKGGFLSKLALGNNSTNTGSAFTGGAATLVPAGGIAGQRQGGGNVTAGNLYKINERGGEGFIPHQGGRIVPTRPDVRGLLDGGDLTITVPVMLNDDEIARSTVRGVKRQAARRR